MIVALVAVRMIEVAIDKVVDVIATRNGLMPAVLTMLVLSIVSSAFVAVSAFRGIGRVYVEPVLIDMAIVKRVQVSIVQLLALPADGGGDESGERSTLLPDPGIAGFAEYPDEDGLSRRHPGTAPTEHHR